MADGLARRNAELLLQRPRGGGRTDLRSANEKHEHVAALLPCFRAFRPAVQRFVDVAGRAILGASLQAGIGEIGGRLVDFGKVVAVGEDDRRIRLLRQRIESRIAKTFVADFEGMADALENLDDVQNVYTTAVVD